MIADNVPFFELSMTQWMEQELEGTGYELVVQSEDNNAVQAQQIMEQMLADKFAFIAKADGTPPEPYESLATIASEQGTYFQNHSVQPITGAGQNVLFDHAAAGMNIGTAAVEWATANGISTPIIGVLGNLADPEGVKRTSVAVETITEAFPDTEVSGEVEAFADAQVGAEGAGNLLAANPDINMLLSFNSIAGLGAVQKQRPRPARPIRQPSSSAWPTPRSPRKISSCPATRSCRRTGARLRDQCRAPDPRCLEVRAGEGPADEGPRRPIAAHGRGCRGLSRHRGGPDRGVCCRRLRRPLVGPVQRRAADDGPIDQRCPMTVQRLL